MKIVLKKHWPLFASLIILWGTLLAILQMSLNANDCHLVYALDDPYIHMAMAKNLAINGTFGITQHSFTASSSSPLWTLILSAAFFIFGVQTVIPLILNIVCASLLVLVIYRILYDRSLPQGFIFGVLCLTILSAPLHALVFVGMEHVLHALFTVLFVQVSMTVLLADKTSQEPRSKSQVSLLWLAMLLPGIRYEGLFVVLVVCILLTIKRKLGYAIVLGLISLTIPVVFGVISVAKGWFFFPTSILLKAEPELSSWQSILNILGWNAAKEILKMEHISLLVFAAAGLLALSYFRHRKVAQRILLINIIFIGTTLLHLNFAKTGWFYRYEAYLIVLGIFVLSQSLAVVVRHRSNDKRLLILHYFSLGLVALLILTPLTNRARKSLRNTHKATHNIFEQQYHMGLFIREFYDAGRIAANDIGVINYMANLNCIDIFGLGTVEAARAKRKNRYDTEFIDELCQTGNTGIALIYDEWYDEYGGVPPSWVKVGNWKVTGPSIVLGGLTVSFYAVDTTEINALSDNLKSFSHRLPNDIDQSGLYMKPHNGTGN